MSYITFFMDWFNHWTIGRFSESFFVVLIVLDSGNRYGTEYMGLLSTQPYLILLFKEFSLLNLNYIYNKVVFYSDELEVDII